MQDWTDGYVAEIGYTYGYYPELNPVAARFALIASGIAPPKIETACELGFGQGVSVNAHAAASAVRWWATDFNPGQAAFARELTSASGSGAMLYDDAFEDFCRRDDVPEMDFIGLHGIWSWISNANRGVIVDFIRRKLKPGGVLYVSYNANPGWAAAGPLRELFVDHAETLGAPGQGIVPRIDAALAFTERVFAANPRFVQGNQQAVERLKKIVTQDRHYIAHEYFNRDWETMSFAQISKWLAPAKVTFACAAMLLDHVDSLHMTPDQLALLREIPDARFRQSVRDFFVNASFRRDYWVRGGRPLTGRPHRQAVDAHRVVLARRPADISLKIGEAKLNETIYQPILDELAGGEPKTIGQLARALGPKGINGAQLMQAIVVLAGKGDLLPAQDEDAAKAAAPRVSALNRHIQDMARSSGTLHYLASPLTGGALGVPRFDQMFLGAIAEGEKTPEEWVKRAWQDLSREGHRLTKDGKSLGSDEENLAHLRAHAKEFAEKRLVTYRGLGIA